MKIGYDAKRIFHNATGLGNYGRDLLRVLSKYYPKLSYNLYNPKVGKIDRLDLTSSIKVSYPKTFFDKKFSSIWRSKSIVKDLQKDEIEIFHGLSGELPRGIEKTNIKSVVTIHDLIFMRYPKLYSFVDRKIHFKKFKNAAKSSNLIIAISEQTKKDIITFLEAEEAKIKVVYQGCHQAFKKVYSDEFKNETKIKFLLPDKYLLNVGTIEPRKNGLNIVKAITKLDVPLVFVGRETAYSQEIKEYASQNKMSNRIHFLKNVSMEELAVIYQKASLFVYPSVFEGFGIPIIEALYSKTPVISSIGGCFSEAGGPYSKYVNTSNIEDLSTMIKTVMCSEELQTEMIEEGLKYVQRFNDDVIAAQMMDIYEQLD